MEPDPSPFSYDAIAYPTRPQSQVHPERLAAMGLLHGLDPAPVTDCRILEVGCGDAWNLAAIAAAFPGSQCVGLDLSSTALDRGRNLLRRCGLDRVELRQADVAQAGIVEGTFDYILCHGLYAWVPEPARDGLLRLCRDHLSPRGLAMISYNALPGACVRTEIREMLRWHVRDYRQPHERLTEARALVEFLREATLDNDEIRQAFRAELAAAERKEPGFFFHDELADHYAPVYFHQFMSRADAFGLQLVADSDPAEMVLLNLPDRTRQIIAALTPHRIEQQQYLDFVVSRRFRHTILCRQELRVAPEVQEDRADRCFFSAQGQVLQPGKVSERGAVVAFERPGGVRMETDFLPGKLALQFLLDRAPGRAGFREIADHVEDRCQQLGCADLWTSHGPRALGRFLLEACTPRVATVHGACPAPKPSRPDHPTAFPVARIQAAAGTVTTSVYHQQVRLDDRWSREIVARSDGTKTVAKLRADLDALARTLDRSEADVWRTVRPDLPSALEQLTRRGLLIPAGAPT